MKRVWRTPELDYYNLYADMLQQPHLLIAGATGSGKSVVINGMMTTALKDSPAAVQFILIDPLCRYATTAPFTNCRGYGQR